MENNLTYYLWKDKKSRPGATLYYITDYLEKNEAGLTRVDGHGWLDVELAHQSSVKAELFGYATQEDNG